jgi:hypothetical protein
VPDTLTSDSDMTVTLQPLSVALFTRYEKPGDA